MKMEEAIELVQEHAITVINVEDWANLKRIEAQRLATVKLLVALTDRIPTEAEIEKASHH